MRAWVILPLLVALKFAAAVPVEGRIAPRELELRKALLLHVFIFTTLAPDPTLDDACCSDPELAKNNPRCEKFRCVDPSAQDPAEGISLGLEVGLDAPADTKPPGKKVRRAVACQLMVDRLAASSLGSGISSEGDPDRVLLSVLEEVLEKRTEGLPGSKGLDAVGIGACHQEILNEIARISQTTS
ncbi:hypothetical protein TWF481_011877 [Arthrobotrys musiformis]|uniref:Uncharacterized protein n=1 Tax=Arthrobotrys musiformis TaxID=47236 RepID=A0AAV9VVF8_9PEZI